jgi:hypothetical protein
VKYYRKNHRSHNINNTAAKTNRQSYILTMYYLIHTPQSPRPYLSTVSFIANDFASWGCRVTRHANNSAYITEVRYQEKRHRPASRRIELMEVWAKEVLARKQHPRPQQEQALPETRKSRASAFAQDFVASLSVFGTSHLPHPPNKPHFS